MLKLSSNWLHADQLIYKGKRGSYEQESCVQYGIYDHQILMRLWAAYRNKNYPEAKANCKVDFKHILTALHRGSFNTLSA